MRCAVPFSAVLLCRSGAVCDESAFDSDKNPPFLDHSRAYAWVSNRALGDSTLLLLVEVFPSRILLRYVHVDALRGVVTTRQRLGMHNAQLS